MTTEFAGKLVEDRFSFATQYAESAYQATVNAIENVSALTGSLSLPDTTIKVGEVTFENLDYNIPDITAVTLPDIPEYPDLDLNFRDMPESANIEVPTFNFPTPAFNDPGAPTIVMPPDPGDMPDIKAVDLPTAPSLSLPVPPAFPEIRIPEAPVIALAPFEYDLPSFSLDTPAPFQWHAPYGYQPDVYTDLVAKVLSDIRNGGTGLDPDVEADIYQRHLDRTQDENARMYAEQNSYWGARGFTLPPGSLAGALCEINAQIGRNNAAASRDIAIQQAELAQKNTQFMVEQGVRLEGMLREFYANEMNRALDAAKTGAQNAIEIYNAGVQLANLNLERFKAYAAVYESQVRAALVHVEIFKSQVEGAKVAAEVQQSLVSVYNAQLGAVEILVKIYVAQIEGAKAAADLETTRVALYGEKVKAYIARLDGEKAKTLIYEAQLGAEGVKATTYKAQVDGYVSQVEAVVKQYEVQIKQMDAIIRQNANEVERYKAMLSAYESQTKAISTQSSVLVDGFKVESEVYKAQVQAETAVLGVKIEEVKAKIAEADMNMRAAVAEIEATTRSFVAVKELQLKGAESIMSTGAQLTASAMNAVNASATYGYGSSDSWSTSQSQSLNESHVYEEA